MDDSAAGSDDPFPAYHRARRRQAVVRTIVTIVPIAIVLGLVSWASAAGAGTTPTPQPVPSFADPSGSPSPSETPSGAPADSGTLPSDPSPSSSPSPSGTLASSGTGEWSIAIDTTGYQTELDRCLWVRMDLGAAAPIVGAHNYCGGGIVLDMAVGDTVTLSGAGLDGAYRVTGDRAAQAGDVAAVATSGLTADVILQTCHWNSGGHERLVTLVAA